MKVLQLEAHNVLRVSDIKFDLAGHHLFLVGGKNGQGKTSALKSLLMALCGKSGMDDYPEVSLKEGEDKGWVRVSLSGDEEMLDDKGFVVELLLRRKRTGAVVEEFRVLDSAGEEAPEPRTLLRRLFSLKAFDPLAFERMKPKEQREALVSLVGLDLSHLDAEYQEVFQERATVNREGVKLKAVVDSMIAANPADGIPEEEISISSLLDAMKKAEAHNDDYKRLQASVAKAKGEKDKASSEIAKVHAEIERLKAKAEELYKEENVAAAKEKELTELLYSKHGMVDVTLIQDEMQNAEKVNAQVRIQKEIKNAQSKLVELRTTSQSLTDRLAAIVEEKTKAIREAPWPVPGMELRDDGLLLDGLPFEQASKSKRVLCSVAVGMALNPKLRLLVCQDGSDLDEDSLTALQSILEEKDFQMIVELVTRTTEDEERCAVIIKEGSHETVAH